MKYYIFAVFIWIMILVGAIIFDMRHKEMWTTYVSDEGSSHIIKAPFLNNQSVCMSTVLEKKIAVYCYAKEN